jgi:hypothetical protein
MKQLYKQIIVVLGILLILSFVYSNHQSQEQIQDLNLKYEELRAQYLHQQDLLSTLQKPEIEESSVDFNDVRGSVYCCGWDIIEYDVSKDITTIHPILVPILITIKGKLPSYIDYTRDDRFHFTFFYINGEERYPIRSYQLVSKASILYGWDDDQTVDPASDLGNGYIVYVTDPNVPANMYTEDEQIIQKMKDFMNTVSYEVIR